MANRGMFGATPRRARERSHGSRPQPDPDPTTDIDYELLARASIEPAAVKDTPSESEHPPGYAAPTEHGNAGDYSGSAVRREREATSGGS